MRIEACVELHSGHAEYYALQLLDALTVVCSLKSSLILDLGLDSRRSLTLPRVAHTNDNTVSTGCITASLHQGSTDVQSVLVLLRCVVWSGQQDSGPASEHSVPALA